MKSSPCLIHVPLVRAGALLIATAFAGACTGGSPADAASPAAPPPGSTATSVTALPATPSQADAATSGASPSLASRMVGTWRQLCQPYLPGDGSSDITYAIDQTSPDRLVLEGIAKDYKNTSCSGPGEIIARPKFEQRIVGTGSVDGIEVVRLVDVDAADPPPPASKSVFGIDNGQLRIGSATGARDADGFPGAFEPPDSAYANATP